VVGGKRMGEKALNDKRLLISISISVAIILLLSFMDKMVYNSVADGTLPISIISASIIGLCYAEKKRKYIRVLLLICLSIYMVLPEYTIAQAEESLNKELPEDMILSRLPNSPMGPDGFDPFSAKSFYTFQVTESSGAKFFILCNPNSGKYFQTKSL